MPCKVIPLDQARVIICSAKARPRRCAVCRDKVHRFHLCDYVLRKECQLELGEGVVPVAAKTCDAVLCPKCAVHVDPDKDYCPVHAAALGIDGRRLRL